MSVYFLATPLGKKANRPITMAEQTDLNNPKHITKPSANQLPKMIHKMLEEREKARAATNLEYALACFMLN